MGRPGAFKGDGLASHPASLGSRQRCRQLLSRVAKCGESVAITGEAKQTQGTWADKPPCQPGQPPAVSTAAKGAANYGDY